MLSPIKGSGIQRPVIKPESPSVAPRSQLTPSPDSSGGSGTEEDHSAPPTPPPTHLRPPVLQPLLPAISLAPASLFDEKILFKEISETILTELPLALVLRNSSMFWDEIMLSVLKSVAANKVGKSTSFYPPLSRMLELTVCGSKVLGPREKSTELRYLAIQLLQIAAKLTLREHAKKIHERLGKPFFNTLHALLSGKENRVELAKAFSIASVTGIKKLELSRSMALALISVAKFIAGLIAISKV